jgi:hypothetical protein
MAPESAPILEILIATVIDRRHLFGPLHAEFLKQANGLPVDILWMEDNKEMPIGVKRQKLLDQATANYIVYFDSDDFPRPDYVSSILKALETRPDCVGFLIAMTTNGRNPKVCCHSLKYPVWAENVDGYDYVRNVTHFNPVKRSIAIQVGFPPLRFGEDKPYSDLVTQICKTEVFINRPLFDYRYSSRQPHKEKYGIKN